MLSIIDLKIESSVDTEATVQERFSKQYPDCKFVSVRLDWKKKVAVVTYEERERPFMRDGFLTID